MAKIAFLLHNTELTTWLKEETKAFPFEELFGTDKPADAYVVLADGKDSINEFYSLIEGHMFAWFGDGAEEITSLHPFFVEGDWEHFDADSLLTTANDMHLKIEETKQKEKEEGNPGRPTLRPKLTRRRVETEPTEEEGPNSFGYEAITEEPQVIAVGGQGGASFVAWNLAAVTRLPLIEGRGTGSLAKWTGDETPVSQALEETLPYGTVSDIELPTSIIGKRVIVDTGSDPHHPVFEHAKIRIWVTTLDPAQSPIPERSKVVVNRVPEDLPFDPREVVQSDIALQVPDEGLDVLISLFTHIPWITKQNVEVQEQWKALVRTTTQSQKGATDTWGTGW